MALVTAIMATLLLLAPVTIAQTTSAPTPAPSPAPNFVNLTDLLSLAGPFHTFLNFLIETQVIQTFQNQANNTMQGITIFVPKDSAFSSLRKPSLSNITQDQLRTLLLFHALPKYCSLSDFMNFGNASPVSTFAGGQNVVNITNDSGFIRVNSGWSDPKISSSVYSTHPIAVYQIDRVLIPEAVFGTPPPLPPAPAPAPETTPPSDLAPLSKILAPKPSESSNNEESSSSSYAISIGVLSHLAIAASGFAMLVL